MLIYTLIGIIIFLCIISAVVNSSIYQRLTNNCYQYNFELILEWNKNGHPIMTEGDILGYWDMRDKFTRDFFWGKLSKEQYSRLCILSKDYLHLGRIK